MGFSKNTMCMAGCGFFVFALTVGARVHSEPPAPTTGVTPVPPDPTGKTPATPAVGAPDSALAERIAKQLIAASPIADPSDSKARDAASRKLGECDALIDAADGRILWGGFNPAQGYDPAAYRLADLTNQDFSQLTQFSPVVWAKLYLSTYMFTGKYEIRREGKFTVLELGAKFRGGMDPGEYPYPFWHSPNKWTAYVNSESVILVFESGRLRSGMRKSPDPLAVKQIRKPWDSKWFWTDTDGNPQPRVALFSYLFSKDNPNVPELEKTYRTLEKEFRSQNCMMCHQPDNRGRMNDLLLLNYPNQALTTRHSLVKVLEENKMPPGSVLSHEPAGLKDEKTLAEMLRLAQAFEKQADAAFAYEKTRGDAKP